MIVLLPVILMLLNAVFELTGLNIPYVTTLVSFFGSSVVALLTAVIYGVFALGLKGGRTFKEVNGLLGSSFTSIAGILMIVGAGGGFKQTLVDSGIADVLGTYLVQLAVPIFVSAWLIAVFIRLATGSATVATITAAGIVAPLAASCSTTELSLIVLAIGAGSMFFSMLTTAASGWLRSTSVSAWGRHLRRGLSAARLFRLSALLVSACSACSSSAG